MVRSRKAHGDKVILDDVTLAFRPGAKIGGVGPNGAGKSTVLKIMAGLETASNGDTVLAPGASVGMLQQEPPLNEALDVRGNVEEAVKPIRDALTRFEEVSAAMGEPDADFDALLAEQGELMETIENADGWELDARIEQAMDALRCPPGDADVTVLSGGERRRVALCKLLLEAPDLLLLDEPTNHLDAESVAWLEAHLEKYAGTVVAVTHDRYFLDNVAEWILELDRGRAYPPRPVLPQQRRGVNPRPRPRSPLPLRGQLPHVPENKGDPPQGRGRQGHQAAEAPQGRARVGPLRRQGPPGQEQGPPRALR